MKKKLFTILENFIIITLYKVSSLFSAAAVSHPFSFGSDSTITNSLQVEKFSNKKIATIASCIPLTNVTSKYFTHLGACKLPMQDIS